MKNTAKKTNTPVAIVHREPSVEEQIASPWGEGRTDAAGFTPVKHELFQLIKFWYRTAVEIEYFWYLYQCVGSERRLRHYANERFNALHALLGDAVTDRAIAEVENEFAKQEDKYFWQAFRTGKDLRRDHRGVPLKSKNRKCKPKHQKA
jgi:hypothetical protein